MRHSVVACCCRRCRLMWRCCSSWRRRRRVSVRAFPLSLPCDRACMCVCVCVSVVVVGGAFVRLSVSICAVCPALAVAAAAPLSAVAGAVPAARPRGHPIAWGSTPHCAWAWCASGYAPMRWHGARCYAMMRCDMRCDSMRCDAIVTAYGTRFGYVML